MKRLLIVIVGVFVLSMMNGCMVTSVHDGYDEYYVDAYVSIPDEVRELIADHVDGYSMPPVQRYGYTIYPVDGNDPYNLPSYVGSDFNGDGYYDYAYMFSSLSWEDDAWYLKTKMLVVVSTSYGYTLSSEIVLGTVSGYSDTPVEEYWGIRLLKRGTHTVSSYDNGIVREESIDLQNDGIYLASVDPDERSVFYAYGTDVHELVMDMGAIAKKSAKAADARANRFVKISTSTLRTVSAQN